jgi:hypothetical protein
MRCTRVLPPRRARAVDAPQQCLYGTAPLPDFLAQIARYATDYKGMHSLTTLSPVRSLLRRRRPV